MKLTEKRRAALKQVQAGEVELRWPFGRGDSYFVAAATEPGAQITPAEFNRWLESMRAEERERGERERAALAIVVRELLPCMDPALPDKMLTEHDARERERIGQAIRAACPTGTDYPWPEAFVAAARIAQEGA